MPPVEAIWAAIVAGSLGLIIGFIWGSWFVEVVRERDAARAERDTANARAAESQAENLRLRRELYELRARPTTPGDHQ